MSSEVPSDADMAKIRTMAVYNEGRQWRKATFAGLGQNVLAELLFCPDKLFEVGISIQAWARFWPSLFC